MTRVGERDEQRERWGNIHTDGEARAGLGSSGNPRGENNEEE